MVKRSTITNTLAGILISTASNLYSQNRSIEFEKDTIWENILEKAKKEDKLIFLDAYTDWCIPCKWMSANVFTNDSVADFYNKNFVNVKINTEKSTAGKELAKSYEINLYPTLLFIDKDRELFYKGVGAIKSSRFIELGEKAISLESKIIKHRLKVNHKGTEIYKHVQKLKEAKLNYSKTLDDYLKTQDEKEMLSRINWEIIKLDESQEKIDSKYFKFLLDNKTKFDSIYSKDSIDIEIFETYRDNLFGRFSQHARSHKLDSMDFNKWSNKVKESEFYRIEEILIEGKLYYDYKTMSWNDSAFKNAIMLFDSTKRGEEIKRGYDFDDGFQGALWLNNIAMEFYSHTEKKELLEKALKWTECSIKLQDEWYNNDTYAIILYSLGKKEEAIKYEEKAIKLSMKSDGNPHKPLTNQIIKMKKGEKIK